jgi:hypothetical protein
VPIRPFSAIPRNIREWSKFFREADISTDDGVDFSAAIASKAPRDAQFIVSAADALLSGERLATNTSSIAWDFATSGQAKASVAYAQTAAELAASVTPADRQYLTGIVERYTNLSSAASLGISILGRGDVDYVINSVITPSDDFNFNLNGRTISVSGNTLGFRKTNTTNLIATVQTTVSVGDVDVEVDDASIFTVGMWVRFRWDDPNHQDDSYPPSWTKVRAVNTTTDIVTLETPVQVSYPVGAGTNELLGYSTMYDRFVMRNGRMDGSANTYTGDSGQALRIQGYESVVIDLEFDSWDNNAADTVPLEVFGCIDVIVRARCVNGMSLAQMIDFQDCRSVQFVDSVVDADAFGVNVFRADFCSLQNNHLVARRKWNESQAVNGSTRGLKVYGCKFPRIVNNHMSDYDSGIKVEACFRYQIIGNTVVNCSHATTANALNVSSQTAASTNMRGGIILGNIVEKTVGSGINVSSDTDGEVLIAFNQVRNIGVHGMQIDVQNVQVIGNFVDTWAEVTGTAQGIRAAKGGKFIANTFDHSDNTKLCFMDPVATYNYTYRDNEAIAGNPFFASSKVLVNTGTATIPSGSTSIAVTHSLIATPTADQIRLVPTENPTNDPGNIWVSSIGATQFTVNCRADPGASNYDIAWRAELDRTFTA